MSMRASDGNLQLPEYDAAGRGNHFSLPAFTAGTKTTVYQNAPPGLLFHGDPGIPKRLCKRQLG